MLFPTFIDIILNCYITNLGWVNCRGRPGRYSSGPSRGCRRSWGWGSARGSAGGTTYSPHYTSHIDTHPDPNFPLSTRSNCIYHTSSPTTQLFCPILGEIRKNLDKRDICPLYYDYLTRCPRSGPAASGSTCHPSSRCRCCPSCMTLVSLRMRSVRSCSACIWSLSRSRFWIGTRVTLSSRY